MKDETNATTDKSQRMLAKETQNKYKHRLQFYEISKVVKWTYNTRDYNSADYLSD